jgi:PKD repeat protein
MRKILAVSSISIGLFVAGFSLASAQSFPAICSVLPLLQQGSNGSTVTILQQFLDGQGYLSAAPTGFFGPLTRTGLIKFQDTTGISAQAGGNGLFGQFTRAYILSHFCQSGGAGSPPANQGGLLTANVTSGQAPLTVTFNGIGSSINFGDGTNQSSQNGGALGIVNHTYTTAGNYVATSGNLQVTISVSGNATTPAGSISSFTNSGAAPLTVTFYVSCTNASTYDVTYGDGSDLGSSNASQAQCNGSLQSFTHTYTTAGSYTATLDLLQQQSNGTFVTKTGGSVGITATGASNTSSISFTASPTSGASPLAVTFKAISSTNLSGYTVIFGDGANGTMTQSTCNNVTNVNGGGAACSYTVSHTYTSSGTYTANLLYHFPQNIDCTTTNPNCNIAGTATVTVSGNGFTATPSSGAPPLAVQFVYTISPSQISNTYLINFGDGSTSTAQAACANDGGGGCSAQASHTYTATGTYPAIISSGGSNLATTTVTVGSCVIPTQNLSLGNSDADSNGQVSVLQNFLVFEGTTIYPAQLVTGFFGNGTLTGVRNFQGKYGIQQTGFVGPLTLTAISQACAGILPPTSSGFSFTASPSSGNAPLAVTFTAKNVETPNSGSYVVAFGDGTQASLAINLSGCGGTPTCTAPPPTGTVSHTYSQNGTYTAQLLIQQNLCGGSITLSGCVSDLQVGTTSVTVGNGVTPPTTGANGKIYVYSNGSFGCNTQGQSGCNIAFMPGNSPSLQSTLLETISVFTSQQTGTIPLYMCSGLIGTQTYGAVAVGDGTSFNIAATNALMSGGAVGSGSNVCSPGSGTANGVWGYIYQGPQSGSVPLYLLSFPYIQDDSLSLYMMTTRPFNFTGGNVGLLGYVPSVVYP